jgi:hypothetical protein
MPILFKHFPVLVSKNGCHNDDCGSQNQPPSDSPMIAAVPSAASAAVNKH